MLVDENMTTFDNTYYTGHYSPALYLCGVVWVCSHGRAFVVMVFVYSVVALLIMRSLILYVCKCQCVYSCSWLWLFLPFTKSWVCLWVDDQSKISKWQNTSINRNLQKERMGWRKWQEILFVSIKWFPSCKKKPLYFTPSGNPTY